MRDELDSRIWVDQHEQFSADIDRGIAAAGAALGRIARGLPRLTGELVSLVAAVGITLVSFSASVA